MKLLLLFTLLFFSIAATAQNTTASTTDKPTLVYEQYGYVNGRRLDSLPSTYIQVSVEGSAMYVDYGQAGPLREQQVNNAEGKKITFAGFFTNGLGALLNFLDYNGWAYIDNLVEPRSTDKHLVFKKKR